MQSPSRGFKWPSGGGGFKWPGPCLTRQNYFIMFCFIYHSNCFICFIVFVLFVLCLCFVLFHIVIVLFVLCIFWVGIEILFIFYVVLCIYMVVFMCGKTYNLKILQFGLE